MPLRFLLLPLLALLVSGCGEPEPFRKPTVPVKGQVTVDGQSPSSPVKVFCHPVGGIDKEHPTVSQSFTDSDGRFSISTYETGDGVPPGEYALTFEWGELNMVSMSYGGPDKLKGRYKDAKESSQTFTVKEGMEPLDLGKIELKTK